MKERMETTMERGLIKGNFESKGIVLKQKVRVSSLISISQLERKFLNLNFITN